LAQRATSRPTKLLGLVVDTSTSLANHDQRCGVVKRQLEETLRDLPPHLALSVYGVATSQTASPSVFADLDSFGNNRDPTVHNPYASPSQLRQRRETVRRELGTQFIAAIVASCQKMPAGGSRVAAGVHAVLRKLADECERLAEHCESPELRLNSDLRDESISTRLAKRRVTELPERERQIPIISCGSRADVEGSEVNQARWEAGWTAVFGPQLKLTYVCPGAQAVTG
jgi:hypothetical protein